MSLIAAAVPTALAALERNHDDPLPPQAEDITRIFLQPPGQAPTAISLGLASNGRLRKA